jgi:hypothetical protein
MHTDMTLVYGAKIKKLEAEVARLRDENQQLLEQIALRQPSVIERDMQLVMQSNNKLRAALEEIIRKFDYEVAHELIEIARKALAEQEGK